jgi:hypothetical protein
MWMNFSLTAIRARMHNARVMADIPRLTGLADARDHLWRARHELLTAGYEPWLDNLIDLIDTIALEIDWLSSEGDRPEATT